MKKLKLILLFVLSPLCFFAQQQLSGLWIGTLSNDSSTVRKDQSFEIVLAEYKGKVSGYSRSTFTVNDTLYYIVKRVKGTIEGDKCEVKDDEIESHNFPKKPEKGVKVISTFYRNKQDSLWYLSGDWKTTQTKKYYTVSGKVDLKEEKDYTKSKIFPHLEELDLDKNLPFYAAYKKETEAAIAKAAAEKKKEIAKRTTPVTISAPVVNNKTETAKAEPQKKVNEQASTVKTVAEKPTTTLPVADADIAKNTTSKPVETSTKPTISNENKQAPVTTAPKSTDIVKAEPAKQTPGQPTTTTKPAADKPSTTQPAVINDVAKNTQPKTGEIQNKPVASGTKPAATAVINTKPVEKNTDLVKVEANKTTQPVTTPVAENKKPDVVKTEPVKDIVTVNTPVTQPIAPVYKPADPQAPAAFVAERVTTPPQELNFVSDSLVLILYDNGEVDGDTVSVLMNNEVIMAKQGLKTAALRKTITIPPTLDEITLLLYAENLGKYPPNTGLLVVYDGEERYQVRFSADLNKNASIILRRKK